MNKIVEKIKEIFGSPEFVPLHAPKFIGNEKKYLLDCIDSTYVSSVGKYVDRLELEFAKFTGAKYAIACANGTSALHVSLQLAGVKEGDEVIIQPLTFIATANAILYCGATPVFVDVDKKTLGLSAEKLKDFLNENCTINEQSKCINKKTNKVISACVPMHTFGHACKIDEIVDICNQYHIHVVEDAAESVGTYFKGIHTGLYGMFGTLSFNGNKTITTGGGGMILTNDAKLAQQAKHITTQAKLKHEWDFVHDMIGYNYRMPNINAALGLAQLENLPKFIESKRDLAKLYVEIFQNSSYQLFTEPENSHSNYWLQTIISENLKERDEFLKYANAHGVMSRPAWQLMHRLEMYKHCFRGDLSNSEWLQDRIINIPSSVR